jgi:eukaryotic-like serine/threonine-protein kinase
MAEYQADEPSGERRLEEVLAEYLRAEERGEALDQVVLIERNPELEEELVSFFRNRSVIQGMARQVQPFELPTQDGGVVERRAAVGEMVRYVGDYELLEEIARGGMGVVYRARQLSLNRIVAVKMILAGNLATKQDVERFRAEAEAAANLDHPAIVPIYEVGEHEGKHYFSMGYIDGGSLADRVQAMGVQGSGFKVQDGINAARLIATVARAVHFAHQRGILHRDLKPANILLDAAGEPHVTDFGLAKQVDRESGMTQSGAILGTPSYMAPEQARAEKVLSTAADVYALGAILYEMLTGWPPFRAGTAVETLRQVLDEEPSKPRMISALVDPDLETIALKCLEKDPSRRYDSAGALAEDLERWQRSEPIQARRAGRMERVQKWVKRRPALAAMGLVAAILFFLVLLTGGLGVAGIVWQWKNVVAEQQRTKEALYVSRVALAGSELARDNLGAAEFMLDQCDKELRGWEWHYLQRALQGDFVTLAGADGKSSKFAIAPGGRRIAATAADRGAMKTDELILFDADSGEMIWSAPCATSAQGSHVVQMHFSPDGKQLYGTIDEAHLRKQANATNWSSWWEYAKYIGVWDAETGRELRKLSYTPPAGKNSYFWSLAVSPDGKLLARGVQNRTAVIDALTGVEKFDREGGVVQFAPLEKQFSAPGKLELVNRVDLDNDLSRIVTLFEGSVFSPDGRWRARLVENKEVDGEATLGMHDAATGAVVWQVATSPVARWAWESGSRANIAFSLDSTKIAGVSADGRVTIWNSATGEAMGSFAGPVRHLRRLAFTESGDLRAVLSLAEKLKIWNVTALTSKPLALSNPGPIVGLAFSPGGERLAALTKRDGALVWDLKSGEIVSRPSGAWPKSCWTSAASIAFSSDGNLIAIPAEKNRVLVWDISANERRWQLEGHTGAVRTVAFDPHGELLASGGDDNAVRTWDLTTGREVAMYMGHLQTVGIVAFHPSGNWVASTSWGAHTHASAPRTGQALGQQATKYGAVTAFSPDGRNLAHAGQEIEIWNTPAEGRLTSSFGAWPKYAGRHSEVSLVMNGHTNNITACVYSVDGKILFTADENGTIKVWDTKSGQERYAMPGEGTGVTSLAVSGQRLAASFQDGTVRIFDGTPLAAE